MTALPPPSQEPLNLSGSTKEGHSDEALQQIVQQFVQESEVPCLAFFAYRDGDNFKILSSASRVRTVDCINVLSTAMKTIAKHL